MTKKELKPLIQFKGVRVVYRNEDNLEVQTLRIVEKDGVQVDNWVFFGYVRTIRQALRVIVNRELLIDYEEVESVGGYLQQVEESHELISNKIDEMESVRYE